MPNEGASEANPGHPASVETVLELMKHVARGVQAFLAESAHTARLGPTDFHALTRLTTADGMTGVELRQALGITSSSITELADRLEERGMLTRTRPRHDRRLVMLKATVRGRRVVQRALGPLLARLHDCVVELSDSERALLAAFLSDVGQALEETSLRTS